MASFPKITTKTSFFILIVFSVLLAVFNFSYAVPTVNLSSPLGGECFNAGSTINISFSFNIEVHHVALYYSTTGTQPVYGSWIVHPHSASQYDWIVPNTIDSTTVKIWVEGHNSGHGVLTVASSNNFSIKPNCTADVDTTSPSIPTGVSTTVISSSQINLSWIASVDNVGVSGYKVYRNGVVVTTTANLSYSDIGLNAGTIYNYNIAAYDTAGNISPQNATVSATTFAATTTPTTSTTSTTTTTTTQPTTIISNAILSGKVTYPDGRAVTNAGIGAHNTALGLSANTFTDSIGNYLLRLSAGIWQIGIYPKPTAGQIIDWSYTKLLTEVAFRDDTLIEETIVDFKVEAAQASVKGVIVKPDGTPPALGTVGVNFKDSSGFEHRASLDAFGSFFISVPVGTYSGQIFSSDPFLSGPTIPVFSTTQGFIFDLGKIYLLAQLEKIKGKVTDLKGVGVGGVWVNARQILKNKFASAQTLADGTYALPVSADEWELNIYVDPKLGYNYTQNPQKVIVPSGGFVEVNFILELTNASIIGNIIDVNGQILIDAFGFISADTFFGGPIERGSFNFNIPAGTYTLKVFFSPDSRYFPPAFQTVTLLTGEIKKVNFTIAKSTSSITGFLKDKSGQIITGLGPDKIKIYLSSKAGVWSNAQFNSLQGSYSVQVGAGVWYLGYWIDPISGYVSSPADFEITILDGQTISLDIILVKADSLIAGTTKSADGQLLANVWISIDSHSFTISDTQLASQSFIAGGSSDSTGNFKLAVPPGTYFVHGYYSSSFGFINPPETKVIVLSGQTINIDLIFKRPEVKISGVTLLDGKKVSSFVWAWGELGGYTETRSDINGFYLLNISKNNRWHVVSSLELGGLFYKSADLIIEVQEADIVMPDVVLLGISPLAQAIEKIVEATKPQSLELTDGAKIILPANSLATSGTPNITLKPVVEAPSFGLTSVVGSSYEVEAKDSLGQNISNLNSEITITIPYKEDDLTAKGLKSEDLSLSFLDETVNVWKPLEKQVVDKASKTVSGVTNHLTRFALIAPADTTPPLAPSSPQATLFSDKTVKLSWLNPKSDFSQVRIYRSEKAAEIGSLVFNNITDESVIDTKTTEGKVYYYTIKSVDSAGNESKNTEQITITITKGVLAPKFIRYLYKGVRHAQVSNLQTVLKTDPLIYPEGLVTGYFGKLTDAAVKRFQTKYGIESIGFVGPQTRAKLNELFSK